MEYLHFLVIFLIYVYFATASANIGTKEWTSPEGKESSILIVQEARQLCRPADICTHWSNNSEINEALDVISASCCQDCSCDKDCGLRGDCCYPTDEDKRLEHDRRKYQECIVPTTKELLMSENYKHRFYYMTTRCPKGFDGREDCGNIHVAPWGSLYPLYSSSTGRIYKNRACAVCHNVHDAVLWTTYMDCMQYDSAIDSRISVADNLEWLNRDTMSSYCQLRFRFEHSLKTERCFLDVIDNCSGAEISIPKMSNMTSDEIKDACLNGIDAPYQYIKAYSNVFCSLCNGEKYIAACTPRDWDEFGPKASLTFLLDDSAIADTQVKSDEETSPPMACIGPDSSSSGSLCVTIRCPSGQIYNKDFICVHPASAWRIPFYHVALRLRLVSANLTTTAFANVITEGRDINSWLLSPWPKSWKLNELYYVVGSSGANAGYVENLLVFLSLSPTKKHATILREVERLIKKDWELKITAKSINLSANFLEYSIGIGFENGMFYAPLWYVVGLRRRQTHGISPFKKHSIRALVRNQYLEPSGRITKMNFCRQIALGTTNSSDYELLADNTLLRYNGKFYLDNEFEVIIRENGEVEPRICLTDSPYSELEEYPNSAPALAKVTAKIELILLIFVRIISAD